MRILIIGASQGTGACCVDEALARGHQVTALSRSGGLRAPHDRLTALAASFHDPAAVGAAVPGHDAVIVTASATSLRAFKEHPDYFSRGTGLVIEAMKAHGVRRLAVLSALGVGESRSLLNVLMRVLVIDGLLRPAFLDHGVQEALVKASGLEWVIARPGRLTNGPARRRSVKTELLEKVPPAISRADVADFLVGACERSEWLGKVVHLGG